MFGYFGTPAFNPKDIPDLAGKVIVITGANGGLGLSSLVHMARHNPAKIYLCARSRAKYDAAMTTIQSTIPQAATFVHFLQLDLSSLASVQAAAQTFLEDNTRLDILMNNAGIMGHLAGLTSDGYEIQFGTNHLGHFLFTRLLLPTLVTTSKVHSPARIINLSSLGHTFTPHHGFDPAACTTDMASCSTWLRYGQSKLANILFTRELARRYPEVISVAIHPGSVITGLGDAVADRHKMLVKLAWPVVCMITMKPDQGAFNQTWAATVDSKRLESGQYYVPVARKTQPSAYARDEKLALKLWDWSEAEMLRHEHKLDSSSSSSQS